MKRWLWLLLLALLPLTASATAKDTDDALNQVMQALASVRVAEGRFREEKILSILQKPLIATGRLYYRAPDFVRKHTLHPHLENVEADGHWLTIETPDHGRRHFDLNGYPQLRVFVEALRGSLAGDRVALEQSYQLKFQGTLAVWTLRLIPRDRQIAAYVTTITLKGQHSRILSVDILETNGDRSLMTVTPH